jgi:hypothetical protein
MWTCLALLAALAAATWWLLASGDRGVGVATVLGFPVAVLALAAVVVPLWKRNRSRAEHGALAAEARSLARQVSEREAVEQLKFLADSGKGQAADVEFAQPDLVSWRTDGGERTGSLSGIAGFYRSLQLGRLLILGEAGAGKTVLANQLLIDLIRSLPAGDPPAGTKLTIPVRLSLPAFDPGDHAEVGAAVRAARLDAWISRHLTTVYGLVPATAAALVSDGWILPVLDGLDEMDSAPGPPARAAATIRALNHPAGPAPRPVVLTCRANLYEQLAAISAAPGQQPVLQDATAVEVQPLTPGRVANYLTRRFPDPARPGHIEPRWQPVLEDITGQQLSPLAATLASPLRLFMAATAYYSTSAKPAELTSMPADTLNNNLFSRLIPAVTDQHPRPGGGNYDPGDVSRWLTTLADHLRAQQTRYGGSGSDIDLHLLWTAAGSRAPRYLAAALQGLLAAVPLLAIAAWYIHLKGNLHALSLLVRIVAVAGAVGSVVLAVSIARRWPVKLRRFDLSELRTAAGRRQLVGRLAGGARAVTAGATVTVGVTAAVAAVEVTDVITGVILGVLTSVVAVWLAGGLEVGLALGITDVITKRPTAVSRPGELFTQGLSYVLTIWLGFGVAGGLALGLAFRVAGGFAFRVALGAVVGFAIGAVWTAGSPWLRYLVACRILARHRRLPRRPARFLDWGYAAGLLRLSGISVQFRHRELQDQLANPAPTPSPRPADPDQDAELLLSPPSG